VAGAAVPPARAQGPARLRLGHGLPSNHPVHFAFQVFADALRDGTGGAVEIAIFPNGLIGDEANLLEQVRKGVLDLVKVSAGVAERAIPHYRVFSLPFLFRDKAHWRAVVGGPVGEAALATAEFGAVGLTFYDAGSRSFYGHRPFGRPEDLRGLRFRIQPSPTMVRMMQLLEAEPVPMPWEVVYSALQARLVDGAENNVTALTTGRHGEVVRHYSFTEHTIVPDVLFMSERAFARLSPNNRDVVRAAAHASFETQLEAWTRAEAEARRMAERMGVSFTAPEKAPFMDRVAPLRREAADEAAAATLIASIERVA